MRKILRELGGESYNSASAQNTGLQMRAAFEHINGHLVGPDAYWAGFDHERKIDSRWGNAWSLPFPPTVVRIVYYPPSVFDTATSHLGTL